VSFKNIPFIKNDELPTPQHIQKREIVEIQKTKYKNKSKE